MNRLVVAALVAAVSPTLAFPAPFAPQARKASPRWGSVDIGVESYRPSIDSEFPAGTVGPYELVFGTGRALMFRLDLSKALYTTWGSIELGIRTGWFQDTGKAFVQGTTAQSSVNTSLKFVPTSLTVGYRLDFIPDRWNVPLAPYGRATLERYNWWVTNPGSSDERGATNGWSVTGGLGFLLDAVDPGLARELDLDAGVNHTYLYFEVTSTSVDDFGSGSSWDLSSDGLSYGGGLMFVF